MALEGTRIIVTVAAIRGDAMVQSSKVPAVAKKPGMQSPEAKIAASSKKVNIDQILFDLLAEVDANPLFPDEETREIAKRALRAGFAAEE